MKKLLMMTLSLAAISWTQTVQSQTLNAPQDGSLLLLSPMAMVSVSAVSDVTQEQVKQTARAAGVIETVAQNAVKACRLLPMGFVGNEWKKYRISADKKVVAGADSLEDLAEVSAGLERMHVCEFQATAKCRLAEEGYAAGEYHRVRIELNGQIIAGADRFNELVPVLEQFTESGFCRLAQQDCQLEGEGPVGGAWNKHRISLDGMALFGAQELGSILEQSAALRDLGLCAHAQ